MNLVQKVGIVLGTTTVTFALGIAACSPLAPSVNKNNLVSRINRGGTADPGAPGQIPNGLHMLFFRDKSGANIVVGKDAYTWFFNTQPKNVKDVVVSGDSLPGTLEDFKRGVDVDIPVIPATDWQPAADGSFSAAITFQLNLVDNSLTPAQVEAFDYDLVAPSAEDVRNALANHASVNWKLKIKSSVPQETRNLFLGAIDSLRLSIATADTQAQPGQQPAQD